MLKENNMKKTLYKLIFIVIVCVTIIMILHRPGSNRIKITNKGTDIIQITYNDKENTEKKMLLGRGGTGCLNKSNSFKINNAFIQIN